MKHKKVALGMSGGVDSSVAAHLLVEQGYEVTGIYLECWRAPGCRTDEDRKDALAVALSLDIPFKVLDFKDAYKNKVVEYFFEEYKAGRTPNPDILCNSEIKFGLFYDWALKNGFDAVATGHYAAIKNGNLAIPKDTHKDQTYFLYRLNKEQLGHIIFPLANLTKPEVREEAKKRSIEVATKKDSVGICFIGDIDVSKFLEERLGENPGEVIDINGNIIGKHRGLWFYTIGQRQGFEIDKKSVLKNPDGTTFSKENFPPFYVVKKLPKTNQLVVGFGAETYDKNFTCSDIHWIDKAFIKKMPNGILVRIRHTGAIYSAKINQINEDTLEISLDEPVQGIAAGQSVVFYTKEENAMLCCGGAVIE